MAKKIKKRYISLKGQLLSKQETNIGLNKYEQHVLEIYNDPKLTARKRELAIKSYLRQNKKESLGEILMAYLVSRNKYQNEKKKNTEQNHALYKVFYPEDNAINQKKMRGLLIKFNKFENWNKYISPAQRAKQKKNKTAKMPPKNLFVVNRIDANDNQIQEVRHQNLIVNSNDQGGKASTNDNIELNDNNSEQMYSHRDPLDEQFDNQLYKDNENEYDEKSIISSNSYYGVKQSYCNNEIDNCYNH